MLTLKPNCEYFNKDLPNHSLEAMICSFEYTFCKTYVKLFLIMFVRIVVEVSKSVLSALFQNKKG